MTSTSGERSLRLRADLAARLRPLVALLVVVIAVAAPAAFYVVGLRTLRIQAAAAARQVAEVIGRDAEQRPVLWRYDSLKLLDHVRTYEMQEGIDRIDVVDPAGVPIEPNFQADAAALADAAVIWEPAPVTLGGDTVGHVWVAASTVGVRTGALVMLLPFTLLGAALAGLMYWLPLRAVATAQARIGGLIARLEESQTALSDLNQNLERQVEQRASELAQAYRELQGKEKRLRELTSRAVQMQEAERRAIARELHDSAGQALTAIRINLQVLAGQLSTEQRDGTGQLVVRTTDMVDDTLEEIRRAVYRLGPAVLDDVGLEDAVVRLCEDLAERSSMKVTCDVGLGAVPLTAGLEATCYRLVQESLTNVARHAGAGEVRVRLRVEDDAVRVEVHDDGRGFDAAAARETSRGLIGMRERVELLGGTLDVSSQPGEGARVVASLPLTRG